MEHTFNVVNVDVIKNKNVQGLMLNLLVPVKYVEDVDGPFQKLKLCATEMLIATKHEAF